MVFIYTVLGTTEETTGNQLQAKRLSPRPLSSPSPSHHAHHDYCHNEEIAANLLGGSNESDHWQQEQHPRDNDIDSYSEGESEGVEDRLNIDYEGDSSSYRSDEKRRTALMSRLALAASVSVLDGLVHDPSKGCDPSSLDGVEQSTGGTDRPSPTSYLDDEGRTMIKAMRYSGIPFVMVQGTEDALVAPPLPLVLQHEV